eukprot:CAMPEP_0176010936 /NCGR_PEP_ID=MMETSP0120_2-20121206/5028_1 /TAXON_ID=160619 /ORGANISM="Kryptoperidinium foliaceum, Strain CCMP 1326" /LENGTH=424 /DNA_ID=CAMNT_0017343789 /DNA_START=95 /DNA_END=1367 /DNA_ORIENTATION=+
MSTPRALLDSGGVLPCGRRRARQVAAAALGRGEAARETADRKADVWKSLRSSMPQDLVGEVLDFVPLRFRIAAFNGNGGPVTVWGPGGPEKLLHTDLVAGVGGFRLFPWGDRVLTWSATGMAVIWNASSGDPLRVLAVNGSITCAQVFPDGDRVVIRSEHGEVAIWDAASGLLLTVVNAPGCDGQRETTPIAAREVEKVFPHGDRLLTWGLEAKAVIWDASTGNAVCECHGHNLAVDVAQVFPEGDKVVTGSSDSLAIIWNGSTCSELHRLRHSLWVIAVAVLGDGGIVATMSATSKVTIWDAVYGRNLRSLDPAMWVMDIVPFPKSDRLATFTIGEVVIWNTTTGEALQRFTNFTHRIWDLAVSPGGEVVATCGGDDVTVWDVRTGARLTAFGESALGTRAEVLPYTCSVGIGVGSAWDPHGF